MGSETDDLAASVEALHGHVREINRLAEAIARHGAEVRYNMLDVHCIGGANHRLVTAEVLQRIGQCADKHLVGRCGATGGN